MSRRSGDVRECKGASPSATVRHDRIVDEISLGLVSLGPSRRGSSEAEPGAVKVTVAEHTNVACIRESQALDSRGEDSVQFGKVLRFCEC